MKWFMRGLLVAVVTAAVLSVGGWSFAAENEDIQVTADVVYGHKHGMALTLDVFRPKQANGVGILFMVSGGWHSQWIPTDLSIGWFRPMLDAGFTVFAVRHGSSPKYDIPEIVEDVRRGVRFVRLRAEQFGVDPDRLGVTGGSAGGHLSLMLGTASDKGIADAIDPVLRQSSRVAAVVAYYPPTDLRPWVKEDNKYRRDYPALQFDPELADDYSPLCQVSNDDPPTLLVHGDKDELVKLDHSEKILAAFKQHNVPAELLVIEGAGHGFGGNDGKRASDATVAWFRKYLLDEKPKKEGAADGK